MLIERADGLWTSRCLLSLGPIYLSRQMVVVKLPDGGLWLHSPNEPTDALRTALDEKGEVAWLVAPNCLHHKWLEAWQVAYPRARLIGAPGLAEKRSDLSFDATLGKEPPPDWGGAFEHFLTRGAAKLNEVAFFHLPSNTLILTDFVFNQGPESGLPAFSRFMLRLWKGYGQFAPSRVFRSFTDDRQAVKQSVNAMLERWPVERVTMSHGEPVSENAAARLRDAYSAW